MLGRRSVNLYDDREVSRCPVSCVVGVAKPGAEADVLTSVAVHGRTLKMRGDVSAVGIARRNFDTQGQPSKVE